VAIVRARVHSPAARCARAAADAFRIERLLESRRLRAADQPPGEEHEQVVGGEPAQRERECARRGRVEPLDVVHAILLARS